LEGERDEKSICKKKDVLFVDRKKMFYVIILKYSEKRK
jgi:hypothetical protein